MLLVVGRSQRCCEKIHSAKDSKESSGPKMSVVPRLRNPSSNCIRVKVDSVSPELKITQLCPRTTDSSLPPLTDSSCLLGPRWHRDVPLPSCLSFLPHPIASSPLQHTHLHHPKWPDVPRALWISSFGMASFPSQPVKCLLLVFKLYVWEVTACWVWRFLLGWQNGNGI